MRRIKTGILMILAFLLVFATVSCSSEPYKYDLDNYITVASFDSVEITDEEINNAMQQRIQKIIKNSITYNLDEQNVVADKTYNNISYTCYYENDLQTPIFGDENCYFIFGDGKFLSEFEAKLLGLKAENEVTFSITFSQDFALKLFANKTIVFSVKIISVSAPVIPQYDDIFVKSISDCETITEFESQLYTEVKEDLIFEKLIKNSTVITYPRDELDMYRLDFIDYYTNIALNESYTLEEYIARNFFTELSDFYLNAEEYAKNKVKEEMLVYAISRMYRIEVTTAEYPVLAQKYVQRYGVNNVSELEIKFGKAFIKYSILYDKVLSYIGGQYYFPTFEEAA